MYSDGNTASLSLLDAIRLRPGMYVGGTDQQALHTMLYVLIEESIEEARFGHVRSISVTLLDDGFVRVEIDDDGIPVDCEPNNSIPILEKVMTQLSVIDGIYHVTHVSVNALSSDMIVKTRIDGYEWQQEYKQGIKTTDIVRLRPLAAGEPLGATFQFRPDPTIFTCTEFNTDLVAARLREIAYLTNGLPLSFAIHAHNEQHEMQFCYPRGLYQMVNDALPYDGRWHLHVTPIHATSTISGQSVEPHSDVGSWSVPSTANIEIAIQFRSIPQTQISYCNLYLTEEGSTHLIALRDGIVDAINHQARYAKIRRFSPKHVLSHVLAVINVVMSNPRFENATKGILASPEIREPIIQLVERAFSDFVIEHPEQMIHILNGIDYRRASR